MKSVYEELAQICLNAFLFFLIMKLYLKHSADVFV